MIFKEPFRPSPWPWNPSRLVAPAQGILHQCEVFSPLWHPGALPFELIKGRRMLNISTGYVWEGGVGGMGLRFPGSGNTEYVIPTTSASRSFLVVFQPVALPASQCFLLGLTSSGAGGSWCAVVGLQNDGDLSYYEVQGTATTIAGGDAPLGKLCAVVGVTASGAGGYQRLFANGQQLATRADTDAAFTTSITRLRLGSTPVSTHPNSPNVIYYSIGYWRRALTDAEALAITADPYMLVRPWEFTVGQALAAARPPRSYASFIG